MLRHEAARGGGGRTSLRTYILWLFFTRQGEARVAGIRRGERNRFEVRQPFSLDAGGAPDRIVVPMWLALLTQCIYLNPYMMPRWCYIWRYMYLALGQAMLCCRKILSDGICLIRATLRAVDGHPTPRAPHASVV